MMVKQLIRIAMAVSLVTLGVCASVRTASAQGVASNRTVMTFSQPVEVPGKVLPAGTYTFELHESQMNRHVIQIYDQAGTKLITTVLAVPNYREKQTSETVLKFAEVAAGQPQAIRVWFYPGRLVGDELVYSKTRAHELAVSSNSSVSAVDDVTYTKIDTMDKADVVSVAPDKTELPVQTPPEPMPAPMPAPTPQVTTPVVTPAPARQELPHTASMLPLVALLGFMTLASGLVLRRATTRTER